MIFIELPYEWPTHSGMLFPQPHYEKELPTLLYTQLSM